MQAHKETLTSVLEFSLGTGADMTQGEIIPTCFQGPTSFLSGCDPL